MPFAPSNLFDTSRAVATLAPPRAIRSGTRPVVPIVAAALVLIVAALGAARTPGPAARIAADADAYVTLVIALERVDPGAVDSYFGPAALAPPTGQVATLADIATGATRLLETIDGDRSTEFAARRAALANRVLELRHRVDALQSPTTPRFDDEARQIYGIDVGVGDDGRRRAALAQLGELLPGPAPLSERVAAFRERLTIPEPRRVAVFAAALAECRRQTLRHWSLPRGERVDVRWDGDTPAAWHRYLGANRSTLVINPQAVAFVGAAIDVACHEAYPGHHAQFVAMERAAGPAGLPVEERVVLLRSPASVLREGMANFGVRLAFPLAERIAFTRDVLYPLAGLPPGDAETDARVHTLLGELEASVVPTLRAYRDGSLPFAAAAASLRDDALIASPEALLRFVDTYGALVVGYTIARDRVAAQVAARSTRSHRDAWAVLHDIAAATDTSALGPVASPIDHATTGEKTYAH